MGLQNEINALHRMAHAEVSFGGHMPAGVWEFDRFFTIEIDDDALYARLGGEAGIERIVSDLVDVVTIDPRTRRS